MNQCSLVKRTVFSFGAGSFQSVTEALE